MNRAYMSLLILGIVLIPLCLSDPSPEIKNVPIAKGWAKNSINATIFRRNSVVTHEDTQYAAFYDADTNVVLAKRRLGTAEWEIRKTPYKGRIQDAHNSISIMVDGNGYLHVSWDHHGSPLNYCRSKTPDSLDLTEKMPMTGKKEDRVTYPEFYRLANGSVIFLYRDGVSGQGDLMLNYYDLKTKKWTQQQDAFIDGEGRRNAYWQMCTDTEGTIHISWVWRESPDVATNHDICYARSKDGGKTWQRSNGETYRLPITAGTAEYAVRIPQNSELINTTSMCADARGRPYIATYWRPNRSEIPQYHLVFHDGNKWHISQISSRKTPFSLSGGGTKRIPISRPQIVADSSGPAAKAYMLFRDQERGGRVSAAICDDLEKKEWRIIDLTDFSVGMWEPSYDTEIWKQYKSLHIFVQKVGQGDAESTEDIPPQKTFILEWTPTSDFPDKT
ncbi:MAG: BNR repeat-containing protein [Candidatus Aminicenantes bacterium]|nr:BNR repeat-containing protein [Candidatus Aminicenantes bacterium]